MPDPSRLIGRITQSSLPTRAVAHLSVVSLVLAASVSGLTGALGQDRQPDHFAGSAPFVSSVRGAAEPTDELTSFFQADPLAEKRSTLDRAAEAVVPGQGSPMATPVPVDPDATPLAAPANSGNVGSTQSAGGSSGPTTRDAQPAPATGALVWPVPGGSISQYFHAGHLALDIAAPYGTQVVAAQGGTVSWAGWRNNGGGYVISIDHGNGMTTVYNHLGSVWVSPGQYVSAGQGIAPVGCTGICTGPHVHFEVIVNGVIDNPLRHL